LVFRGAFCLTTLYFQLTGSSLSVWQEIQMPLIIVGIFYLLSLVGKFGADYFDDECGLIFDRPSGKVSRVNLDGSISHVYDFKDFKGEVDTFINTGGQKELTAFVSHKTACKSVLLGQGFDDGVIAWSYLVRFMDVSKPLPDIPEHETTRHLDPVTKAYDEKTGRDPNYWAKYTAKEFHKLKVQDRKKAAIWIEERKQLLNERGIEDLDFLNQLLSGDIST